MVNVFTRSAFNYDVDAVSKDTGFVSDEESLTQQNFKDECDINTILRRFAVTGEIPENVRVPQYQDFDEVFDFHSAMNVVRAATEAFDSMPANVRERFGNDPGKFVAFTMDEANYDEALKLGIVNPRPPKLEEAPPVVSPVAPESASPGTTST